VIAASKKVTLWNASCTIASATARASLALVPTTKMRVLWSVMGRRPSSLAWEACGKGIDTALRRRGVRPTSALPSINTEVASCARSRSNAGFSTCMTPPSARQPGGAQLVSADVSISEFGQVIGKPLATAAKETIAVQDQRLTLVRDGFRDLGCVGDV